MSSEQNQDRKHDRTVSAEKEGEMIAAEEMSSVEQQKHLRELQEKVVKLEAEAKKNHELYLRVLADMENMRKRAAREREEYLRFATLPLVKQLLTVIDDLERAIKVAGETEDVAALRQGVSMTAKNLSEIIRKEGVEPIECVGIPFDPQYHEPLTIVESEEHPENTVIDELQKGYTMKGRLLRPSLVKVSK